MVVFYFNLTSHPYPTPLIAPPSPVYNPKSAMSNLFICQELIDDVGLDFPENPQPQASRERQSGVFVVPCTPAADSDPYHADPSYADTIQQDSSFASYREQVYSWLMDVCCPAPPPPL